MKRLTRALIVTVAVMCGLGGTAYYLAQNVDWARVYYKRLKAENEYVFDTVHPRFKETDPAKLIGISAAADANRIRNRLVELIWGRSGLPSQPRPEAVSSPIPTALASIEGVNATRLLKVPIDIGYSAYLYVMEPAKPNRKLVIYQHGYAGTAEQVAPLFKALLAKGFTVVASNYPGYGQNQYPRQNFKRFGQHELSHDRVLFLHPRPLRFYVEPIIATINQFSGAGDVDRIDLVGFSAGGWAATLAAAVDRRVATTISVAGGYPLYLRVANFERESPPPQIFPPLMQAANYPDMYVLAAEGRRYIQIFNRYDRCCYRNALGKLYEPAVRDAVNRLGEGRFEVHLDVSHADHKVSDWAIKRIVTFLDQ